MLDRDRGEDKESLEIGSEEKSQQKLPHRTSASMGDDSLGGVITAETESSLLKNDHEVSNYQPLDRDYCSSNNSNRFDSLGISSNSNQRNNFPSSRYGEIAEKKINSASNPYNNSDDPRDKKATARLSPSQQIDKRSPINTGVFEEEEETVEGRGGGFLLIDSSGTSVDNSYLKAPAPGENDFKNDLNNSKSWENNADSKLSGRPSPFSLSSLTPLCLREGDNSNSKENTAIAVFPKPEEEIKAILARDTVSIGLLFEETAPKITAILQENPGTILQVEYLIRKLLGNDDRDHIEEIKPQLRSILVKGEKQKLWDSVPDAQNCWTIDLTLLPDYAPFDLSQLENLTVHSKGEIVLAAIDRVLKNAAPEPLSSNQIAQMLCPKKISLKQSKYFFKRVQSLLPNWSDRFNWKKLDRGVYLWVGNSTLRGVKPQKTPQ